MNKVMPSAAACIPACPPPLRPLASEMPNCVYTSIPSPISLYRVLLNSGALSGKFLNKLYFIDEKEKLSEYDICAQILRDMIKSWTLRMRRSTYTKGVKKKAGLSNDKYKH